MYYSMVWANKLEIEWNLLERFVTEKNDVESWNKKLYSCVLLKSINSHATLNFSEQFPAKKK